MVTYLPRIAATFTACALALWAGSAAAQSSRTHADITAGAGFSSNPLLAQDSRSSAFGRLSAFLNHTWLGERSTTSLSAYVENTTYLKDYGSKQIFSLNANTQYQASETTRIYGSLGFSGDLSGQLANRFTSVPTAPPVPDPVVPPLDPLDPDLFSFAGRQYRLTGQVGASFSLDERSSLSVSGGAERVFSSSDFFDDYTTLFVSSEYARQLSERMTGGIRLNLNRTEYDNSSARTTIVNPELTLRSQLSPSLEATGAIGVTFARQRDEVGDSDTSTNLSLSGALCRTTQSERFCGRVSRYATNSTGGLLVTNSSLGVDWFKRIDQDQTVQLSASAVRYSTRSPDVAASKSTFFRGAATYDRRLNDRLSAGADVSFRSLALEGPNPGSDVSASVFVRYRLGDVL